MKNSVSAFCSVLIVDDDNDLRESMREGLATSFMEVIAVESGLKAIDVLRTRAIDVVVTDHKMPGMSGVELLKYVRANYPLVPVLMVTGYSDDEQVIQALSEGAFDILDKPYRMEVLVSRIQNSVLFPQVLRVLWSVLSQEISAPKMEEFLRRPFAQQMSLLQIYANSLKSRSHEKKKKSEGAA